MFATPEGMGCILPDWPAPKSVHALTTLRHGGVSEGSYASLNLGDHVGDQPQAVAANRQRLFEQSQLPAHPKWLNQIHSKNIVDAGLSMPCAEADGSYTFKSAIVCAVLTADCLPVLLCDKEGTRIGAVHAGWRGIAAGVIEAGVQKLYEPNVSLMAWLGPAIGPQAFEVGSEVREIFLDSDPDASNAFEPSSQGRWLANLYMLATRRLQAQGITEVYGGHWCTYSDKERFFSYRRDGITGRMATLIWMNAC